MRKKINLFVIIISLTLLLLMACGEKKIWTVEFDVNGKISEAQYATAARDLIFPSNPRKENQDFVGWFLDKKGVTEFNPQLSFTNYAGEFTIYAIFSPKPLLNVEFVISAEESFVDTFYSGGYIKEPSSPSLEGKTFIGWYKDAEYTQKWFFGINKAEKDIKLHAKFLTERKDNGLTTKIENRGNYIARIWSGIEFSFHNVDSQGFADITEKLNRLYNFDSQNIKSVLLYNDNFISAIEFYQSIDEIGLQRYLKKIQSEDNFNFEYMVEDKVAYIDSLSIYEILNSDISLVKDTYYANLGTYLIRYLGRAQASYEVAKGVETIGFGAFANQSINSISIPQSVKTIKDEAFSACVVSEINFLPNSNITKLSERMFFQCQNLVTVNLTNLVNLNEIGRFAFYGCISLNNIYVADSVVKIDDYAFALCSAMEKFEISTKTQFIGQFAFYNTAITKIDIPNSVISIGEKSYFGCSNVDIINVGESNKHYMADNGVLFDITGQYLIKYPSKDTRESYTVRESVLRIEDGAFVSALNLKRVILNNNLTDIGKYAFSECVNLSDIDFANTENLKTISESAFVNCSSIKEIVIPKSVEEISAYAFESCLALKKVAFVSENRIKILREGVFYNCQSLMEVTLPSELGVIEQMAFAQCVSLASISLPNTISAIDSLAFGLSGLVEIFIPKSVVYMGSEIFYGNTTVIINCEVDKMPKNWNKIWHHGSYFINWNAKRII